MTVCQACGETTKTTDHCEHCKQPIDLHTKERPALKAEEREKPTASATMRQKEASEKKKQKHSQPETAKKEPTRLDTSSESYSDRQQEARKRTTHKPRPKQTLQQKEKQQEVSYQPKRKTEDTYKPRPKTENISKPTAATSTRSQRRRSSSRASSLWILILLVALGAGGYYYTKDTPTTPSSETTEASNASPQVNSEQPAEANAAVTVEDMQLYMNDYLEAAVLTYNNRDIAAVKKFIEPNSKLMKDTADYLVVLNKRGIYEELLHNEVVHMESIGNDVYNVTVLSQYNISFNHGETRRFQSYRVVYQIAKQNDSFITKKVITEDLVEKREL